MKELENKVIQWAQSKGIFSPESSINKNLNSLKISFEAAGIFLKNDPEKMEIKIGDVLVTLAIFCHQNNTDLETCLQKAYDKISNRTGKTINGSFVKRKEKSCLSCKYNSDSITAYEIICDDCSFYSNYKPD